MLRNARRVSARSSSISNWRPPLAPHAPRMLVNCSSNVLNEGIYDADTQSHPQGEILEEEELFPVIQLELPPPTHTKVKTATYLSSCIRHEECPPPKYPEFAVIGRSNVGKSSLINMITNSKKLAHVSKEPGIAFVRINNEIPDGPFTGKTRCINHFLINNSWYLVDLPGYG
jgi:GTP-binding protein